MKERPALIFIRNTVLWRSKNFLPERMENKEGMLVMQQQCGKQINDGKAANLEHRY